MVKKSALNHLLTSLCSLSLCTTTWFVPGERSNPTSGAVVDQAGAVRFLVRSVGNYDAANHG